MAANLRSQRTYWGPSNRSRVSSEPNFRGAQAEASPCCKTDIVYCKDLLHCCKKKKKACSLIINILMKELNRGYQLRLIKFLPKIFLFIDFWRLTWLYKYSAIGEYCWDAMDSLLLGPRNFFDNQTRHWHPSRVTIRVSITGTVSNVDANADIPFSDVVTVALYCSVSEVTRVIIADPHSCVNRQRSVTLGAVESDEPSLAAFTATSHIDISLEYNMKSCIVFSFNKHAILKIQHYILLATSAIQNTVKYDSRYYSNLNVCSVAIL